MNTPEKKYIGTYYSQMELFEKIDALKLTGNLEEDMYIVTNDERDIRMIRGRTEADVKDSGDENWIEKVKHFIMGEEPVTGAFERMGFSKEVATQYYAEAKKGGMLLFVDRELGHKEAPNLNDVTVEEGNYYKANMGVTPSSALHEETKEERRHLNSVESRTQKATNDKTPLERAAAGERVDKGQQVTAGTRISEKKVKESQFADESTDLDHRLEGTNKDKLTVEDSPLKKASAGEWVNKEDVHAGKHISEAAFNKGEGHKEELDHRLDDGKPHR